VGTVALHRPSWAKLEQTMNDGTYNGWTNYATWRVNLEVFDGGDWEGMDARDFKDLAEEHIESQSEGLARDYALAFLSDVNWYEIAKHNGGAV
jgi:hypothetical protein